MAKKTSNKTKSAVKPTPSVLPDVPVVVEGIQAVAIYLRDIANLPETTVAQRDKLIVSIEKYADRVSRVLASVGKNAEKEAKKAEREAKKAEREAAKKAKTEKKVADLRAKLAELTKELKS